MIDSILTLASDAGPLLIVAAGALFLIAAYRASKNDKRRIGDLEVVARPLMTPMELRTIVYIERAVPDSRVHAQVSMGALLKPRPGLDKSTWWKTFYKFCSKRVDFVVQNANTGAVMFIVELDDRTHDRFYDRQRDKLLKRAGYVTVRLPANRRPTEQSVKNQIQKHLQDERARLFEKASGFARRVA